MYGRVERVLAGVATGWHVDLAVADPLSREVPIGVALRRDPLSDTAEVVACERWLSLPSDPARLRFLDGVLQLLEQRPARVQVELDCDSGIGPDVVVDEIDEEGMLLVTVGRMVVADDRLGQREPAGGPLPDA